jgi:hypothetical protein
LTVPLRNTLIVLIGFAGTGKYTVGRLLSERTGAKLIDNQLINMPLFTAVDADGVTTLPAAIWDKVSGIRRLVYETIAEIAPPGLSYIFTFEMRGSEPAAHAAFRDLETLAAARESVLVPIRLLCDVEEICRRIANPSRAARLKDLSPDNARRKAAAHTVLDPRHENTRTFDTTALSPEECADNILREVEMIRSRP